MSREIEIYASGEEGYASWIVGDDYQGAGAPDLDRLMAVRERMDMFSLGALNPRFTADHWMQAPREAALALAQTVQTCGIAHYRGAMPAVFPEVTGALKLFADRFRPDSRFYVTNLIPGMQLTAPTRAQIDILAKLDQFDGESGMVNSLGGFTTGIMDFALGVVDRADVGIFCIEDTD